MLKNEASYRYLVVSKSLSFCIYDHGSIKSNNLFDKFDQEQCGVSDGDEISSSSTGRSFSGLKFCSSMRRRILLSHHLNQIVHDQVINTTVDFILPLCKSYKNKIVRVAYYLIYK